MKWNQNSKTTKIINFTKVNDLTEWSLRVNDNIKSKNKTKNQQHNDNFASMIHRHYWLLNAVLNKLQTKSMETNISGRSSKCVITRRRGEELWAGLVGMVWCAARVVRKLKSSDVWFYAVVARRHVWPSKY